MAEGKVDCAREKRKAGNQEDIHTDGINNNPHPLKSSFFI